jgi:hypothetical protein
LQKSGRLRVEQWKRHLRRQEMKRSNNDFMARGVPTQVLSHDSIAQTDIY